MWSHMHVSHFFKPSRNISWVYDCHTLSYAHLCFQLGKISDVITVFSDHKYRPSQILPKHGVETDLGLLHPEKIRDRLGVAYELRYYVSKCCRNNI